MKGWTSEDILRIQAKRSTPPLEVEVIAKKKRNTSPKITQKVIPKILDEYCHLYDLKWQAEYTFSKSRMFRFDYAIPSLKIAVEYEGLMSGKSRHTTVTGYTMDTEKYNLANGLGWDVIRVTALNVKDFELYFLRLLIKRLAKT